jgi:hypothetical protein
MRAQGKKMSLKMDNAHRKNNILSEYRHMVIKEDGLGENMFP